MASATVLATVLAASGRAQDVGTLSRSDVRDETGGGRVFVELSTPRDPIYVHQPFELRVRFGFEESFFESEMIQPFRRELEVPVQVQAEWWTRLPGALLDAREGGVDEGLASIALEDAIAGARRLDPETRDGLTYRVFELVRRGAPQRVGRLDVSPVVLRFAYAEEFKDDLLQGRVPVDRKDASVHSDPLSLEVVALPEEGMPLGFCHAVGRFTIRTEAEPRELEVGQSFALRLTIEGEGNLRNFDAPELDALPGFHVRGRIEEEGGYARSFIYDLTPLDPELLEVPAIPFVYFDPESSGEYRTVWSIPIPIEVRSASRDEPETPPKPEVPSLAGPSDPPPESALEPRPPSPPKWPYALFAIPLGIIAWWLIARARSDAGDQPSKGHGRAAAACFQLRIAEPEAEVADALAEFLATCLGCSIPAVIAPDLAARLEAAGAAHENAQRGAALMERLTAARYGGGALEDAAGAAGEVVESLQDSLYVLEASGS